MSRKLGEITLTKEDLEAALQILNEGCTGNVTIVFADSQVIGMDVSDGFEIEPKSLVCKYGCKDQADILAAINSQKGVVRGKC